MYLIYSKKFGLFIQKRFRVKAFNIEQFFHLEFGWIGFWIAKRKQ